MISCDPAFERLLKEYLPQRLGTSEDTIYGVWADLTLAYFNDGWTQFAARNEGEPSITRKWTIGRNIQDAIPEVLQSFYLDGYRNCLATNQPWEHEYECSSAQELRRFFMRAYPLNSGQGILIVNSLIHQSAHLGETCPPQDELYRADGGLIVQCCHCRRVLRNGMQKTWDLVPEWIANFPRETSHGVCEPCFGFYYGSKKTIPQAPQKSDRADAATTSLHASHFDSSD